MDETSRIEFELFKCMPHANREHALSKMKKVRDSKDRNSIQGQRLATQYSLMMRVHKEQGPDAVKEKINSDLAASRRLAPSTLKAIPAYKKPSTGCPCPPQTPTQSPTRRRETEKDARARALSSAKKHADEFKTLPSAYRQKILTRMQDKIRTVDLNTKEGKDLVTEYNGMKRMHAELEASKRPRSSPPAQSTSRRERDKSGCRCPKTSPQPDPEEVAKVLKEFKGKLEEYKTLVSKSRKSILSSLKNKIASSDKYSKEGRIYIIHYAALKQAHYEVEDSKRRSRSPPPRSSRARSSRPSASQHKSSRPSSSRPKSSPPSSSRPKSSPPSSHSTAGQAFNSDPAALEIKRKQEAAQLAANQEREAERMEQRQLKEAKELEAKQWEESKRLEAKQLKEAEELEARKRKEAREQAERQRREKELQRVKETKNMAERERKQDADFEALAFKGTSKEGHRKENQSSKSSTAGVKEDQALPVNRRLVMDESPVRPSGKSASNKSCPCSEERRNSPGRSSPDTTGSSMKSALDTTASSYHTANDSSFFTANDSSFKSSPNRSSSVPKSSPKRPSSASKSSPKRSSSAPKSSPKRSSSSHKSSSKRSSSSHKSSSKRSSSSHKSSSKRSSSSHKGSSKRASSSRRSSSKPASSSKSKRESRSPSHTRSSTSRRDKSGGCPCPKSRKSSSRSNLNTTSSKNSSRSNKSATSRPASSRPKTSVRSKTPPSAKSPSRPSTSTQRDVAKPTARKSAYPSDLPPKERRPIGSKIGNWKTFELGRVLPSPPRSPPQAKRPVTPPSLTSRDTHYSPAQRPYKRWSLSNISPPHSKVLIPHPPAVYLENGEPDEIVVLEWMLTLTVDEMDEYLRQNIHILDEKDLERIRNL